MNTLNKILLLDGQNPWFPGKLIGGASLILSPLFLFLGTFLRYLPLYNITLTAQQAAASENMEFAAPGQLAAYQANPKLMTIAYAAYLLGILLLCPAAVTFAQIVARKRPGLAFWGGLFVLLGLTARLYHAGADHTAFALVGAEGVEFATKFVMDNYANISYGPLLVPVSFSALVLIGWPMLALGAFLAGTFGPLRSLVLAFAGYMWIGVLKDDYGWINAALLAMILIPLGIRVLRGHIPPSGIENN